MKKFICTIIGLSLLGSMTSSVRAEAENDGGYVSFYACQMRKNFRTYPPATCHGKKLVSVQKHKDGSYTGIYAH